MTKAKNILWKLLYIAGWMLLVTPVLLVVAGNIDCVLGLRYLKISWADVPTWLLLTLIALLPTLMVGLTALIQHVRKAPPGKIAIGIETGICILLFPVWGGSLLLSLMANPLYSQTEDIAHYRQFDERCNLENAPYADALLPLMVEGTDAAYAYWYSNVGEHDVYAAWTLVPEALEAEVSRVDALMAEWDVEPEKRGAFICYNDTYTDWGERHTLLFAYNPDTGEVRYAVCEMYGEDIPVYERQAWGKTRE